MAVGLKKMYCAHYMFKGNDIVAVCHVDDLLVFEETENKLYPLKGNLRRGPKMIDLGTPR